MLEKIFNQSQEFDQVKKKYQKIRDVLEKTLASNKSLLESTSDLMIRKDIVYKEMPFQIELSANYSGINDGLSDETKLKKLIPLTIYVTVRYADSEINICEKVHSASCITARPDKTNSSEITISEANVIIDNLEGIAALLDNPREN